MKRLILAVFVVVVSTLLGRHPAMAQDCCQCSGPTCMEPPAPGDCMTAETGCELIASASCETVDVGLGACFTFTPTPYNTWTGTDTPTLTPTFTVTQSQTATRSTTRTALATPTVTPTVGTAGACILGDADNSGAVSLGEVQQCVSNFLGASNPAPACPLATDHYTDNGDGTITDNQTGLMWAQKTQGNSYPNGVDRLTDAGNAFNSVIDMNGGLAASYSSQSCSTISVDGASSSPVGFAGYCDWRMPNIEELKTIVDLNAPGCGVGSPCIDSIFGLTLTTYYWSASSFPLAVQTAWATDFIFGGSTYLPRGNQYAFRAVRGAPLP